MTEEFKRIIDTDIEKCKKEIKSGNQKSRFDLLCILDAKYSHIIDGFASGLRSMAYDKDGSIVLKNIEMLLQQIELFKAMEYTNAYSAKENSSIEIHNNNSNVINMNVTFDEVRENIENMSALRDSEIEEILSKIDELEKIVQSKDRKSKKWERAKDIVKWIADKGVDVGIAFLPLLFQIQ